MKCKQYSPDSYGRCTMFICAKRVSLPCSHGWIPFWTEAERAGLKALGNSINISISHDQDAVIGITWAIRAYVSASRRVKEPSCDK